MISQAFQDFEKGLYIRKDNNVLLNKLVDISRGKQASATTAYKTHENFYPAPQQHTRSISYQTPYQVATYRPTSLNFVNRKNEIERIQRENHALAQRLFEKKSLVEKKRFDGEY